MGDIARCESTARTGAPCGQLYFQNNDKITSSAGRTFLLGFRPSKCGDCYEFFYATAPPPPPPVNPATFREDWLAAEGRRHDADEALRVEFMAFEDAKTASWAEKNKEGK